MTAVGDTAPDFTLKDQNGNDVTLSSFRGQARRDRLLPVHVHRRVRGRALRDPRRPVRVRARRRAGARHLVRHPPRPAGVGRAAGFHLPGAERLLAARRGEPRPTACSTRRSAAPTAPRSCSTRTASRRAPPSRPPTSARPAPRTSTTTRAAPRWADRSSALLVAVADAADGHDAGRVSRDRPRPWPGAASRARRASSCRRSSSGPRPGRSARRG